MTSLGQRIVYYRKRIGITQRELAAAIGMSSTALSYYETDKREPNILILTKLIKALGVTADTLLGLERLESKVQNRDEYTLLRFFRSMNDLGQERLLEFASGFSEVGKYSKVTCVRDGGVGRGRRR